MSRPRRTRGDAPVSRRRRQLQASPPRPSGTPRLRRRFARRRFALLGRRLLGPLGRDELSPSARHEVGAREHEREADDGPHRDPLAEHDDARDDRDRGIDVGDRRRLHGADLGDQAHHEQERERAADHGEHDDRHDDRRGRPRRRPAAGEQHERHVDDGGGGERHGDDADAGKVGHPPRQDRRAERVADDHDRHLGHGDQVGPRDVEADQRRDAEHSQGDAEPVHAGEPLGPAHREGDAHSRERHGGQQQPRRRAGQPLLGRAQEVPREDDLHDRVRQHGLPAAHHLGHLTPEERQRQQQDRRQRRPPEDHHRGVQLAHRHLDEQVRDAPGDAERNEQDQPSTSHPFILAAAADTERRGAAELTRYPANHARTRSGCRDAPAAASARPSSTPHAPRGRTGLSPSRAAPACRSRGSRSPTRCRTRRRP